MPVIAVLCVVGVFSYNNNPFHLALVLFFGVIGYLFDKMGYSAAPLILGLILGNLADAYFRRALFINDGDLISLVNRPISFIFFLACMFTVLNQFNVTDNLKKHIKKLYTGRKG